MADDAPILLESQLGDLLQEYETFALDQLIQKSGKIFENSQPLKQPATPTSAGVSTGPIGSAFMAGGLSLLLAGAAAVGSSANNLVIKKHSFTEKINEILLEVFSPVSKIDFMRRHSDRIKTILASKGVEKPKALSTEAAENSENSFRRFLSEEGVSSEEINRISPLFKKFVDTKLPEISVLAAVQELRNQFHPNEFIRGDPYPSPPDIVPDPIKFLKNQYGAYVKDGSLTTGKLQDLDNRLYQKLYQKIGRDGLNELVEPRGKPYARRAQACAEIVAGSAEDAARFFGGLRPERIARHREKLERER